MMQSETMAADDVAFKFVGGDQRFLTGLPAQDLTRADVASLTPEQKSLLSANLDGPDAVYMLVTADAEPVEGVVAPEARLKADKRQRRKAADEGAG